MEPAHQRKGPWPEEDGRWGERWGSKFAKTKFCKFFMEGRCNRGEGCSYAHCGENLKPVPDLFRTKQCRDFRDGSCPRGDSCNFAHGIQEIRLPATIVTRSEKETFAGMWSRQTTLDSDVESEQLDKDSEFVEAEDPAWLDCRLSSERRRFRSKEGLAEAEENVLTVRRTFLEVVSRKPFTTRRASSEGSRIGGRAEILLSLP
mmetsp:Transcript_50734/g.110094  ORF Transcript_50734/g.110094 Transcript_50734/m.110094 type:complete len:203 (+) Transcript_50734:77-685(+)|eukprot:CAMPEP_0170612474 /NCGR_PEP_ID=MMETSP0224-20130122/23745_1 /TAXON_ID=285029 /ORGANISM="Togula jolla, Strain CCCM 725" /LENGTH=202 /DNA_ID=CAMNT_0010937985 /DNA_START=53 /DNA_END=661 /DNA_ORIENTATION=-